MSKKEKLFWGIVSVLVVALLVGMFYPRLEVAGFSESEPACEKNLLAISESLLAYQGKFGKMPESLNDLRSESLPAEVLICPSPSRQMPYLYSREDQKDLVVCQTHIVRKEHKPYRISSDFKVHSFRLPK